MKHTRHKFNNDLLMDRGDRARVRESFPLVADALIDDDLVSAFAVLDKAAMTSKARSRKSGRAAVGLGVLSLVGMSASPLYHHAAAPVPTLLDVLSAGLGVVSVLIGFFGVLHSTSKEEWLLGRWQAESMRQFHFQYLVEHIRDVAASSRDCGAVTALHGRRARAMAEILPTDRISVSRCVEDALAGGGRGGVWIASEPDIPAAPGIDAESLAQFLAAYRELRIGHQISYAEHALGKKRGPLRITLDRHLHKMEQVTIGSVLVLLGVHFAVVAGGLFDWPVWLHQLSGSPWMHAVAIWVAAFALGGRVLEDGYGLRADLARYSDYLFHLNCVAKRYDADTSLVNRLALMRRTEELAFAELVSFVRSARKASYVL